MHFLVRDLATDEAWIESDGDLSLGGIHWQGSSAPRGTEVEVRFRLEGALDDVCCRGQIIRVTDKGPKFDVRLRFTDLALQNELAIAKHLDAQLAADAS